MELVWKDPPPRTRETAQAIEADEITAALKERPGEWALVGEGDGLRARLRFRECEVAARKNGDSKIEIYARWPNHE